MEVYERIRELRKRLHLTQTEFGDRLGVSLSVINNIEYNRLARPDQKLSLIKLMCKEFGVNEEWLLTGEGEPFPEKSRHDEIADFVNSLAIDDNSFKSRFIVALSKLNEEEWLTIEKVVKEISEETASVPQDPVAMAEEEYIKSASEPVPPMAPAASNSTADDGNSETA